MSFYPNSHDLGEISIYLGKHFKTGDWLPRVNDVAFSRVDVVGESRQSKANGDILKYCYSAENTTGLNRSEERS